VFGGIHSKHSPSQVTGSQLNEAAD